MILQQEDIDDGDAEPSYTVEQLRELVAQNEARIADFQGMSSSHCAYEVTKGICLHKNNYALGRGFPLNA